MKRLYASSITLFILSVCHLSPINAQNDGGLVHISMNRLGFEASFYNTPKATTNSTEEETCYCFEDIVTEKEHPNKSYRISVWESANGPDTYADKKVEELCNKKLHGSNLELFNKSTFPRGGSILTHYILKNKKTEGLHFIIGSSQNKVYVLEIETRKDCMINAELLPFIQSFNLTDYQKALQSISIDRLNYTINFPYPPEVYRLDALGDGIKFATVARAVTPSKMIDVTIWMADGEEETTQMPQKVDSVDYYRVTELHFTEEIPLELSPDEEEAVYQQEIRTLVNTTNGRLISQEKLEYGNLRGLSLQVEDVNQGTYIYRIFFNHRILYILEARVQLNVRPNHPSVTKFMNSFSIK